MLAPASASSWCPTMDLLALATTDGQLSLSRLEWNKQGGERENKLWSTNPDAPVTSLGWRPDGKVLVSGHADGTVVLHHVEDGETLHVSKPHARAVTSLHWQIAPASDAARSAFAHQSAAARFTLPPRRSKGGGGEARAGSSSGSPSCAFRKSALVDHFDPPDRLTVLVSGDASGVVSLSAFGVVPLGSADLTVARGAGIREDLLARGARGKDGASDGARKDPPSRVGVVVQHATASPDLSRVLVGFGVTERDDASSLSSQKKENRGERIVASYVAAARVPLLAARSRELRDIAAHAAALAAANDAVREGVAAAAAAWRRARRGFSQAVSLLARRAREEHEAHAATRRLEARENAANASSAEGSSAEGGWVSLEDRFAALLAVGDVDLVLERFLSHEFDAAAARRVAKQIDAAATEAHRTLLRDVGPAAETAGARVAELRAYARWRERAAGAGLNERALDAAVASAERVALAAAAAARAATETASQFRAFFALVLRAQRALAGKNPDGDETRAIPRADPALCRAFLARGFEADALGAQLEAAADDGTKEDEDVYISDKENRTRAARRTHPENRTPDADGGHADDERAGYASSRASFLASVRGAAAAAGFARADEEEKHLPPLWRAAAAFRGACASALEGPAAAVSASFAWRRAFAVVAAGADAGGAAMAPRATHGGFADWSVLDAREGEDDDGERSEDGERRASSAFETVVFHAGAASVAGRHSVGLLALRDGVPEKALAIELPEGQEIVDAAAYTKGRVLALCQPAGGARADPSRGLGAASVVMLDPREATRGGASAAAGAFGFVALARRDDRDDDVDAREGATLEPASAPPGCAPASSIASAAFGGSASGTERDDDAMDATHGDVAPPRRRMLPGLEATAPLAVGPSKGLAAVLVGSRRIALLDLEEDECDEDDGDDDEEDDE